MTTEQFPARGEYAPGSLGYIKLELADARELLAAIRDDEVNAQDEADKFLRDNKFSALHAALEENAKLAARVAELEAFQLERQSSEYLDAERYRYLRDRADENSDGPIICSGLGDNFDFLRGAECDEEIDAARGSKP